jgi:TRAP-type mannitol/chloroaromatic compound transport system permease large subunit
MVFFLAFFLDFFEIAFIVVPLLAPAAERIGIDLIWFGIILSVNMQTAFMHPPFGSRCSICARSRRAIGISTASPESAWRR